MLTLFYAANFHEYLKSGVWYRGFWSQPLSIMIAFILIDTASQSIPKLMRKLIFTFIAALSVFCWFAILRSVNASKTENHYLDIPRGGIYINNSPSWITTVEQTTDFLNKTL